MDANSVDNFVCDSSDFAYELLFCVRFLFYTIGLHTQKFNVQELCVNHKTNYNFLTILTIIHRLLPTRWYSVSNNTWHMLPSIKCYDAKLL